jgi:hypothetical protein
LHGQLLMFHVAPRTTLALLGWKDIDTEKGDLLKATVRTQTQILLEQWSREGLKKPESSTRKQPVVKSAPRKRAASKSAKAAANK